MHDRHDAAYDFQVEPNDLLDVAVLHFDYHARSIVQVCFMDLAKRSACNRRFVQVSKELGMGLAEFFVDRFSQITLRDNEPDRIRTTISFLPLIKKILYQITLTAKLEQHR